MTGEVNWNFYFKYQDEKAKLITDEDNIRELENHLKKQIG
jgi:hypothetical protein